MFAPLQNFARAQRAKEGGGPRSGAADAKSGPPSQRNAQIFAFVAIQPLVAWAVTLNTAGLKKVPVSRKDILMPWINTQIKQFLKLKTIYA